MTFGQKVWKVTWLAAVILVGISLFNVLFCRVFFPPLTPLMVQRFFEQVKDPDRSVHFERDYVRIDKISPNLVDAVVASEDGKFMHHDGFDVEQLKISYMENKRGHRVRGGSTISMQTAKNAFLTHRRSVVRKVLEAYYTKLIEAVWGKKRIMEVYLNIIEFGDGIYGCEAAAQHYFGHSAAKLTTYEAAQLAVTLPGPLWRNPAHKTPYFRSSASMVQGRMAKYGHVRLDAKKEIQARDRERGKPRESLFDFIIFVIDDKL